MLLLLPRAAVFTLIIAVFIAGTPGPALAHSGVEVAGLDPAGVDPAGLQPGHPTGHVHDRADQTWPPQPRGLRNVVPLGTPGGAERAAGLQRRRVADRERIALARADVRQALGNRYNSPDLVEPAGKGVPAGDVSRLVYFSYERNATVEVTVAGQGVQGVRQIPATEYQPDITDVESLDAVALARQHFVSRGRARVADLQGFGILAYLPTGKGFYPMRVIYVTFHRNGDAPPEYAAWVDLTNRRVLRTREEQP
jgi:hypothetical protein